MSKSKDNVVTIKETLEKYSARQVRFLFLLHHWSSLMDYKEEDTWTEALRMEKQFSEFFKSMKDNTKKASVKDATQRWIEADFTLQNEFLARQRSVRAALCNSFDTCTAIQELASLVSSTNTYM